MHLQRGVCASKTSRRCCTRGLSNCIPGIIPGNSCTCTGVYLYAYCCAAAVLCSSNMVLLYWHHIVLGGGIDTQSPSLRAPRPHRIAIAISRRSFPPDIPVLQQFVFMLVFVSPPEIWWCFCCGRSRSVITAITFCYQQLTVRRQQSFTFFTLR